MSGNNGEQATIDHGGVFTLGSETKVVVRKLRSIEAVISRFFASPVEKHRTKIRSYRFLGIRSTLLHRQDAFRQIDGVVSRHGSLETPSVGRSRSTGRREREHRTRKRETFEWPIFGCNLELLDGRSAIETSFQG